jgi:hypothetical protein
METHHRSTIFIGGGIDVVSLLRTQVRGLGMSLCTFCAVEMTFPLLDAELAHHSSYAESAIIPTTNLKPARHSSFFKKYAAKKFMKVQCSIHPHHVTLTGTYAPTVRQVT